MINKILTIIILFGNVILRRKHFTLKFHSEVGGPVKRWYYDFPHWGFEKNNLEMVAGADTLLDYYADGQKEVTLEIYVSKELKWKHSCNPEFDTYKGEDLIKNAKFWDRLQLGRGYTGTNVTKENAIETKTFWICPVTLFVLGRYPNYIYVRKTATIVKMK
jgi:hypothetical protein